MTSPDMPTLAGMPVDPDEERWLALDRECDRLREAFQKYAGHVDCPAASNGTAGCSCGFSAEWDRVFGVAKGVDSEHG